ncbi:exopolyphosphatase/guanosine-5'-triphosphate,3'-diphosphate pyrophosphatase [Antricoccus suffuscus]|uniref:Exopolyphosphatase/guanosine-5'-triphosphate, 3'-diphosphate pyrophosphatase n=1 Tax=Antricoccus suffuscus TaxID=1629062 RepID=A0A2T1A023_9ACTN|nr:Ppx/GppA phosphatase family protein [Antricoccus suffuscus]PRZ41953.1 exopolyphosphatase/guanosine-5'-triphosphate,3'-diphosphate pyrophosphatase [Antricoccus suffuscus]
MTSRRVAAIDCGTNTIRLLIGDVVDGRVVELCRLMETNRLGAGLGATGLISAEALDRSAVALSSFAVQIEKFQPETVRMVATSASRDARNSGDFIELARASVGVRPEVITGREEAQLSFAGATVGLDPSVRRLVIDIGGGSTEFVVGDREVRGSHSTDMGCVRLTERHLKHDPPTADELTAVRSDVVVAIDEARGQVDFDDAAQIVGVAGTVTTIAGIALGLPAYDAAAIHQSVVSAAQIAEITEMLTRADFATKRDIPVMHPGRVDVIAAGALILDTVMQELEFAELTASETDILHGIALSIG